jgi:isopentenyl-diphosphate delta-isomerase
MMWTNTCCSHPLFTPSELDENAQGIKVAAKRRLESELGISPNDIDLDDFHYLTRIHYKALSNSVWGEHEIDYILFLQKDLPVKPNVEEVAEIRYMTLDQIRTMASNNDVQLTPWFDLIYKTWLPIWWNNLSNLKPFNDHKTIHKM